MNARIDLDRLVSAINNEKQVVRWARVQIHAALAEEFPTILWTLHGPEYLIRAEKIVEGG
jgi:hypothetical protein